MSPSGISRTQGNVRLASAKWAKAVINQVAVAEAHNVLLTERGSQAIVTPHRPFSVLPRGRQPDSEASRTLVMQPPAAVSAATANPRPLAYSHHHPASAVLVWLDAARGRCQAPAWLVSGLNYEDWSYSSSKRGGRIRLGHQSATKTHLSLFSACHTLELRLL